MKFKLSTDPVLRITVVAKVSGGGVNMDVPVSSAVFKLSGGTVPVITLTVDMGEPAANKHDFAGGSMTATAPIRVTADKLLEMHNKACKIASSDDSSADLKITVVNVNKGNGSTIPEKQEVSLTNWRVIGAGLIGGSASGGLIGIKMRIAHPCSRADKAPGFIGFRTGQPEDDKIIDAIANAQDLVSMFTGAVAADLDRDRAATDVTAPEGGMAPDDALTAAKAAMKKASDVLTENFESTSGIPLHAADIAGDVDIGKAIAAGVAGYFNGPDRPGLLEVFMNDFLPNMQLTFATSTDQTGKLAVVPYAPWGPETLTLNSTEITSMRLPAWADPAIGGVMVGAAGSAMDGRGSFLAPAGTEDEPDVQSGAVLYIPEGTSVIGRILHTSVPAWLQRAANYINGGLTPTEQQTSDFIDAIGGPALKYPDAPVSVLAAGAFVKSVYLAKCGAHDEVLIVTPLQFTAFADGGKHLTAGSVYGVKNADKTDMFFFYATDVTHTLDIAASTAETIVRGAYFRLPDNKLHGTTNPMYTPAKA